MTEFSKSDINNNVTNCLRDVLLYLYGDEDELLFLEKDDGTVVL